MAYETIVNYIESFVILVGIFSISFLMIVGINHVRMGMKTLNEQIKRKSP